MKFDFEKIFEGVFSKDSSEYEILTTAHDLISNSAPTIAAEAKTHLLLLDHSRMDLSTMYYMLGREISKKRSLIQSNYDTQYTRLVKVGRPSNAAIEAEIRATNPEYAGISVQIQSFEEVRDLIASYIKCIDSSKQTTIEILRDSRRID